MFFSDETLKEINALFDNVSYVEGSHQFEHQGDRTKETFLIKAFSPKVNDWSSFVPFVIWNYAEGGDSLSLYYDSDFATGSFNVDKQFIPVLAWAHEKIKKHPSIRLKVLFNQFEFRFMYEQGILLESFLRKE